MRVRVRVAYVLLHLGEPVLQAAGVGAAGDGGGAQGGGGCGEAVRAARLPHQLLRRVQHLQHLRGDAAQRRRGELLLLTHTHRHTHTHTHTQ